MDQKAINDLVEELGRESLRQSHPNGDKSSALMFSVLANILTLLRDLALKERGVQGLSDNSVESSPST